MKTSPALGAPQDASSGPPGHPTHLKLILSVGVIQCRFVRRRARAILHRVVWSCLFERQRALEKAWKHPTGEGPVRPRVARALRALSALRAPRVRLECVMISDGADGSLRRQKLPGPSLDRPNKQSGRFR